jgi:hypothetical protein
MNNKYSLTNTIYAPVAGEHLHEYEQDTRSFKIVEKLAVFLPVTSAVRGIIEVILDYVGVWGLHYYFTQYIRADNFDMRYFPSPTTPNLTLCTYFVIH